jgi:hypothetical protein
VAKGDNYYKHRVKEALEITKDLNNINRDIGLEVSGSWILLIHQQMDPPC